MSDRNTVKIGQPLLRREDRPILTGVTRFTADVPVPGALHLAVLRSSHAHARIRSIDTAAATAAPGVVAVYTGEDLQGEWAGQVPVLIAPDPAPLRAPAWGPLARGKVTHVGEAVAVVVAESREQADDALEGVVVDYEVLPAVVDLEDAVADRVVIHDELGTNQAYTWEVHITPESVEAAFAAAAYTVKQRHRQQRLLPAPMETRAVCAVPEPVAGGFILYSSTQMAHLLRSLLAMTVGVPEHKLRVIAPAVGGGFGSKLQIYPEESLCLALARRLGRPVRWIEDRSESGVSMIHGRGQLQDIELAADADGTGGVGAGDPRVPPGRPREHRLDRSAGTRTGPARYRGR